jgi:rubrerythrin
MARWVCDHCGEMGRLPEGETAESVQCPICGEPVLPYDG